MSTSRSNPNKKTLLWVLLGAALTFGNAQAGKDDDLEFAAINRVPIYQLWSVLVPQHAQSGTAVATYWPFDSEAGLYAGTKRVCGLLLLGSPDTESRPAGFEIRNHDCSLTLEVVKNKPQEFIIRTSAGARKIIKIGATGNIQSNARTIGHVQL